MCNSVTRHVHKFTADLSRLSLTFSKLQTTVTHFLYTENDYSPLVTPFPNSKGNAYNMWYLEAAVDFVPSRRWCRFVRWIYMVDFHITSAALVSTQQCPQDCRWRIAQKHADICVQSNARSRPSVTSITSNHARSCGAVIAALCRAIAWMYAMIDAPPFAHSCVQTTNECWNSIGAMWDMCLFYGSNAIDWQVPSGIAPARMTELLKEKYLPKGLDIRCVWYGFCGTKSNLYVSITIGWSRFCVCILTDIFENVND